VVNRVGWWPEFEESASKTGQAFKDACPISSKVRWEVYLVGIADASDAWAATGVPERVELKSARLYFGALTYPCAQFFSILLITTCIGCES
jgi:hypothetical protein